MKIPKQLLQLLVWAPAWVVSLVFFAGVLAFVPPVTTTPLFLSWVVVVVALARGRFEAGAVQALTFSRSATTTELAVLAPVLDRAAATGSKPGAASAHNPGWGQLRVVVRCRHRLQDPAARLLGHHSVVVNPGLVESLDRGLMTHEEAAALLVCAAATHRAERRHAEVAVLVATTPWRMVMGLCRPALAAFTASPLGRWSWLIRGLLAVICVIQAFTFGQPVARFGGAAVILLTYAVPAACRALRRRTELAADLELVRVGLGPAWLRFLQRSGYPIDVERRYRLQPAATTNPVPHHVQQRPVTLPVTLSVTLPAAVGPALRPDPLVGEDLSTTRPRLWLVPNS